jgi:hypothetical protein
MANAEELSERTALLFGAAEAQKERIKAIVPAPDSVEYERILGAVRTKLGEQQFATAFKKGQEMNLPQAAQFALSDLLPTPGREFSEGTRSEMKTAST